MCGFFALVDRKGSTALDHQGLLDVLAHRGPDHKELRLYDLSGETLEIAPEPRPHLALGHLRLSILDPDPRANQPFESACGRYVMVYNGEVYNYVEMRNVLAAEGCTFRTEGDTEVLLQAIGAWGAERACREAEGMFAFALLDRREGTLTLGRDHLGIKPLFRAEWAGGWAWASEVWPLLGLPDVSRAPRLSRIAQYITSGGQQHDGGSFFAGIERVEAAHLETVQINVGAPETRRFWRLETPAQTIPAFEATEAFSTAFETSVRRHLRADVPLGVALSGGLDSSAIAGVIRKLEPDMDLHTFSFLPETQDWSEERWIDSCATHVNAISHKVRPTADDLLEDVEALIRAQGEPFGTTSIYAQFRVMRLAAGAGIKVMLDGQGADELLGGYSPYVGARLWSLLRAGRFGAAQRLVRGAPTWVAAGTKTLLWDMMRYAAPRKMMREARRKASGRAPYSFLTEAALREATIFVPGAVHAPNEGFLRAVLNEATTLYGLPELLRYEDRNSMHVSLESRVPFLTRTMAETCASLPESALIDANGRTKSVLRDAITGLVPEEIRLRRDKIGFRPDIARMNGPILDHVLREKSSLSLPDGIDWDAAFAQLSGDARNRVLARPHTWRLMNLALWYDAVARAPSFLRNAP